ncbi:MAG: cytochrome c biogenesis protein CcsA [Symbiopectobacterium sp.]
MDNIIKNKENPHKVLFSLFTWFNYILLLWGHYHEGWRGRCVVWFSAAGAMSLTLAYFGGRIIQYFVAK